MRSFRKISIDKCDKLWSELVRARDGKCAYCGKKEYLAAHHIFGRSNSATRFLLENGISLCPSHHVFSPQFSAHRTEQDFRIWVKKLLGSKYRELEKLSHTIKSREKARKEFLEVYELEI